jgi:hypothetical protein
VLDPATLERTDLAQPDVWLPVVDSSHRVVTYWSGALRSENGIDWALGPGELVLDRWSDGGPDAGAPSADPSADPAQAPGPQGSGVRIVEGAAAAFQVRFDPEGTRVAVWVTAASGDAVGRLSLHAIDPATGAPLAGPAQLADEPALQRFSIDTGRLAWVSPSGQDGAETAVKVLGWSGDALGEIETLPARDLYIVR